MRTIEPEQAVADRIGALQASRGVSDVELGRRMAALGFTSVGRDAIRKIKAGERQVSLNEALAFAWALDIAPVHLIVPLDNSAGLKVGHGLDMDYVEARSWIRGRSIRYDEDEEVTRRREAGFYFENLPPNEQQQVLRAGQEVSERLDEVAAWEARARAARYVPTEADLTKLARKTKRSAAEEVARLHEEES